VRRGQPERRLAGGQGGSRVAFFSSRLSSSFLSYLSSGNLFFQLYEKGGDSVLSSEKGKNRIVLRNRSADAQKSCLIANDVFISEIAGPT
jgi:hypothetical protein